MSDLPVDEKNIEVAQIESPNDLLSGSILADSPDGVRKSTFDSLAIWQTVKIFRRAVFYCCTVYTLSMLDGWSVSRCISSAWSSGG